MIARSRSVHEWCDQQLVDYGRYMLRHIKTRFLIPQVKHLFVEWHSKKRNVATDPDTIVLDEKQKKRSAFAQKKLQRQTAKARDNQRVQDLLERERRLNEKLQQTTYSYEDQVVFILQNAEQTLRYLRQDESLVSSVLPSHYINFNNVSFCIL
jgi:hypothetical protein